MTNKLKANIVKGAVMVARDIVANDNAKADLANQLLRHVHDGRVAGLTVNSIWADIARDMGFSDKDAKIQGAQMPGTLAVYRSTMRKADKVGANFGLNWAAFKADIADKAKAERAPHRNEKADKAEAMGETEAPEVKLAEIAVPAGLIKRIAEKRLALSVEKRAQFDDKIAAWIAGFAV